MVRVKVADRTGRTWTTNLTAKVYQNAKIDIERYRMMIRYPPRRIISILLVKVEKPVPVRRKATPTKKRKC